MDGQNLVFKTVTKFDGFGATVNLQIHGDKNDKNLLGAFISIGMLALSLALSFNTFLQFVNGTNPTITSSLEYSTQNLTINYTNFFFGISFFQPLKEVRTIDKDANDFKSIKFINQLNISCTTCEGEYLNSDAIMNLCNADQFENITLKSMSKTKSNGINSIFSTYSFCFPQDLTSIIKDNVDVNSTQESSLQLFIPVNDVSIEFTNVKQNLAPQPGTDTLKSQISTSSSTVIATTPEVKTTPNIQPSVSQPVTNQPPQNNQPATSQQQPATNQPPQNNQPGTTQQQPASNQQPQQQANTRPQTTQTNQQPTTQIQNPTGTQQPAGTINTQPTGTSPQQAAPPGGTTTTQQTAPTGGTTTTQQTAPTGGTLPPKRLLQTTEAIASNITTYIDNSVKNTVNKTVYDMMNIVFMEYKFPKMLVIHRGVEVTTASKNVINFVYHLEVLDYKDPLTGNPNVFDVYLQKYQVYVDEGSFFSNTPKMIEFIVVNKIEKNSFDSLQNSGAYLSYKLYSDSQQIYVKYVSITDVLGVFGSFYSIFSLFAGLLSGLYNELFLDRKLLYSIFKFVGNKPESNFRDSSALQDNYFYNKELEDFIALKRKLNEKNNKNLNQNSGKEVNSVNEVKFEEKDKGYSENIKDIEVNSMNKNPLMIEVTSKLNKQDNKNNNNDAYDKLALIKLPKPEENEESSINPISKLQKINSFQNEKNLKGDDIYDSILANKENLDTTYNLEVDFRDIIELHREKKKKKKKYRISILEYLFILKCSCCCKKKFAKKKEILTKCKDVIDEYLQINNIIRKFMEFELIKKLLMTENQRKLLKYQFKYLNFDNPDSTINYLDSLISKVKPDEDMYDKDENNFDTDLRMIDNFSKYYNF